MKELTICTNKKMVTREIGHFICLIIIVINIALLASSFVFIENFQWNQNAIKDNCNVVDHLIKPKFNSWEGCLILNVQNYNFTRCLINNLEFKMVEWKLMNIYPIGTNFVCYYQSDNIKDVSFMLRDLGSVLIIPLVIMFDVYFLDFKLIFKGIFKLIKKFKLHSFFVLVPLVPIYYLFVSFKEFFKILPVDSLN